MKTKHCIYIFFFSLSQLRLTNSLGLQKGLSFFFCLIELCPVIWWCISVIFLWVPAIFHGYSSSGIRASLRRLCIFIAMFRKPPTTLVGVAFFTDKHHSHFLQRLAYVINYTVVSLCSYWPLSYPDARCDTLISPFCQWLWQLSVFMSSRVAGLLPGVRKDCKKLPSLPADPLEKIKPRWVSLTGSSFQIWLGYRSQMKPRDSFCLCVAVRTAVACQHRAMAENNAETMSSLYIAGYCVGIAIEFWTLCFCLGQTVCRRWRDDGWISVCFIRTILQPLAAPLAESPSQHNKLSVN